MVSLKWATLGTLAGLVLAVIFLQQHVEALAIVFAIASGFFLAQAYAGWRGRAVKR